MYGSGQQAIVALDQFSLTLSGDRPTFTAIAGESGSGKTTLARLLLGFTRPTSGEVLYRGKELWKMSRGDWLAFRQEVQAIFQDPFEVFNPFYRVDHLLTIPVSKFRLARSKAETREQKYRYEPDRARGKPLYDPSRCLRRLPRADQVERQQSAVPEGHHEKMREQQRAQEPAQCVFRGVPDESE